MNTTNRGGQMINPALGAAVGILAPAVLTFGATPAHADDNYQVFASPLGHIGCVLNGQNARGPIATCQIRDHTYTVAPGVARDQNGGPCPPGSDLGSDFRLDQGQTAYPTCTYGAIAAHVGPWPILAYGQTRSLGTITCDSEPAGMTCTDSGTGHFFRLSPESYQVG